MKQLIGWIALVLICGAALFIGTTQQANSGERNIPLEELVQQLETGKRNIIITCVDEVRPSHISLAIKQVYKAQYSKVKTYNKGKYFVVTFYIERQNILGRRYIRHIPKGAK